MLRFRTLAGAGLLAVALGMPARAALVYGTDFDSLNLDAIAGQDGWVDDTIPGVPQPDVIVDPTGGAHGQVLRLESNNADDSSWAGAFRPVDDLPQSGEPVFSITWDQFRPSLGDNLWFAEDPSYGDWYGYEWDQTGAILPQFSNTGQMPLKENKWQNVRIDFDYTDETIEGFVDGVSGGKVAFEGPYEHFRGLDFELVGTTARGGNNGPNYIDNLRIYTPPAAVPEPGSLDFLAAGLLPLLRLRRRHA